MATIGAYKGVDITKGTDAEVAAQLKKIDDNLITPSSFKGTTAAKVTQPPPATSGDGFSEYAAATADSYNKQLQDIAAARQKDTTGSLQDLISNMLSADGQTSLTAKEYQRTGVDTAEAELKDINSQIIAEQRALDKQIRALKENKQGLYGGALEQEIDRVRGESITRQADLGIIQMVKQGKYDSAKQIADRAVAAKLERQAQVTEALKLNYEANKELFTKAEQRAFESAQKDREQKLQNEEYRLRAEFDQKIRQNDPLYQAQLRKALTPDVRTVNGVDMQYNEQTGQWETIGQSTETDSNTKSQLTFLRDTVTKAKELSNAAGASGFSKFVGDKLIGDTKFRRLEAQTNTLRTNVLTLMTDPGVKKYFGPQMSEADVRLMTAAGTTLNPESQSPEDLRNELIRLDALFQRMQDAVQAGSGATEGDTREWQGTVYRVINGTWVPQ